MAELFTGIVLCGGNSKRMGADKGLLMFNGKYLFEHSTDLLKMFCSEVFLIANNPFYFHLFENTFADEITSIGPLAGILTGLKKSSTNWTLIMTCDQPLIAYSVITKLTDKVDPSSDIIVFGENKDYQPFPGLYSRKLIPLIENLIENNKFAVKALLDRCKVLEIRIPENSGFGINVNTPDDFNLLTTN